MKTKVEKVEHALRTERDRLRKTGDTRAANAINSYLQEADTDSKTLFHDILMSAGREYEVEVNCFKPSGKWYAGGKITLPGDAPYYDPTIIFEMIADRQDFLQPGSFRGRHYLTVMNVTSDYDSDEYCKVIPMAWPSLAEE